MIIWSGWGVLGLLIPGVVAFLFTLAADAIYGPGYSAIHSWPLGLGLLVSAALVYLLSERLARPGRTLIDPATGQAVVFRRRDSLFFIPLKYIAILIAVAAIFVLLTPRHAAGVAPSTTTTIMAATS